MATRTFVETFPKSTVQMPEVEAARDSALSAGATSSVITEDDANWILTTVFSSVASSAKKPS